MPSARWLRLCGPHGECVAWPRYRTFADPRLIPLTTPEYAPRELGERRPLCRGRTSMDCGATWTLPHLPTAADCGSSFLSRRSARSATRYAPTSNLVWRKRPSPSRTQADPRVPCSAILPLCLAQFGVTPSPRLVGAAPGPALCPFARDSFSGGADNGCAGTQRFKSRCRVQRRYPARGAETA